MKKYKEEKKVRRGELKLREIQLRQNQGDRENQEDREYHRSVDELQMRRKGDEIVIQRD
jgi:hypothetical protein